MVRRPHEADTSERLDGVLCYLAAHLHRSQPLTKTSEHHLQVMNDQLVFVGRVGGSSRGHDHRTSEQSEHL